jgi:Arc/MetJ-type ribon-helix-helix transcriptional regulator
MKLSVSLPAEDIEFLDAYAESQGIGSRSAVLHKAVRILRTSELGAAYEAAWHDWDATEAEAWEQTVADGLGGR